MNGLLIWGLAFVVMASCAIFGAEERAKVTATLNVVEQCQERAREASIACLAEGGDEAECDPKAVSAYKACKRDAGIGASGDAK